MNPEQQFDETAMQYEQQEQSRLRQLLRPAVATLAAGALFLAGSSSAQEAEAASVVASVPYDTGDGDYPDRDAAIVSQPLSEYEKNGSQISERSYAYRNCTDYAAWRAIAEGLVPATTIKYWGDAKSWDTAAKAKGFQVDEDPEVGDIAQWEAYSGNQWGHVAFVESVTKDKSGNVTEIRIADYNKTSVDKAGEFDNRSIKITDQAIPSHYPDSFIDLNGKNGNDFKLRLYERGYEPVSVNEQNAINKRKAEIAQAKAFHKQFSTIPNDSIIRGANAAWYVKKGNTLQWMVTGDAAAKAIGIDRKRYGKTNTYTEPMLHSKEEGYTHPYTQRDKDAKANKLGTPIDTLSVAEIGSVAKKLGFDSTIEHISGQGAKGWRFKKNGKRYDVNMDLVAMLVTGRSDVLAYPKDWKDGKTWQAYPLTKQRASYFALPLVDIKLADYIKIDSQLKYKERLAYLTEDLPRETCQTPGKICAWGETSPLTGVASRPELPSELDLAEIVDIASFSPYTGYALKKDGTVVAWGLNSWGQIGNTGVGLNKTTIPTPVLGLRNITAIAAGNNFTLALNATGEVYAWGNGQQGTLGTQSRSGSGNVNYNPVPIKVEGLSNIASIAAGIKNGYAVDRSGNAFAWGRGEDGNVIGPDPSKGALGDEKADTYAAWTPVRLEGLAQVKTITSIGQTAFAITAAGNLYAWGNGFEGQLGDGRGGYDSNLQQHRANAPQLVKDIANIAVVGINTGRSVMVQTESGRTFAWGWNRSAGLGFGYGTLKNQPEGETAGQSDYWKDGTATPTEIYGLQKIKDINGSHAIVR